VSPLAEPVAVCGRLRLDDVVEARDAGARLIVSAPTSPFCHAANVLRYWSARGHDVAWKVSRTLTPDDGLRVIPGGSWLASTTSLTIFAADGSRRRIPIENPKLPHAGELRLRALEADAAGVVAMGGKRYDKLSASLMAPGLSESAEAIALEPVAATRLSSGHLALLSSRVSRAALREIATDLIRQFFSVLLVLHEAYTYVIQSCLDQLDPMTHGEVMLSAIPAILSWQCDAGTLPSAEKSIFDTAGEMPVPPMDLETDLALTRSAIAETLIDSALTTTWQTHFARVMVLKEWKFYVAKVVHRHFGRVFAALAPGVTAPTRAATGASR
jgi:hypothetical protein